MKKFMVQRNQLVYDQHQIIESMSSANEQFETLRQKLTSIKESILNEFDLFKKESLQIYENSYQLITNSINETYQSSKEVVSMISSANSDRLRNEISKINTDYLNTKRALIKSIYLINTDILRQQDSIIVEFEEKKESWNSNRFRYLIEKAKSRFLPISPINYDNIYNTFYMEQQKFNNCFSKKISDISLLIPPDQFSQEALTNWWSKVDEFLKCHDNFIDQFTSQFQSKMNQNFEENNKFITDIETELFEITKNMNNNEDSRNAQYVIDEINSLCKVDENVNLQFIEKVKSYFCYNQENLKKSFESIRNFYQEMIENHQNYINDLADREAKEAEEKAKLENDKKSAIQKLESEINESKKKISFLVSEEEINDETAHCKQLLSQIEQENRNYYEKVSAIFEDQPSKVLQIFEKYEKVFLDFLKVRKIQKEAKNAAKKVKKNQSKQKDGRFKPQISETFKIECGLEFESFEPLSVIPSFTDFFELPSIPSKGDRNSTKSEKGRRTSMGRKSSLKSPSKSGKGSSKSGSQSKQSSLSLIDFNEAEIPSFDLNDVIPKIDDKIAIYISLPTMDDFNEWFGQFKVVYLNFFYELFEKNLKKSENEKNKKELLSELNENLRILNPRFSSIEVNCAEERKIKIASQKDQLDLYFRRISLQFNSLVSKYKANYDCEEKSITSEVEKLRKFSDDLKLQKNGRALTFHHENFRISDKNCQSKMADFLNRQEKSLADFFDFFRTKNDRFKNVCLSQKDGGYSEEEKSMLNSHFECMDKQMNEIEKSFRKSFQTTKTTLEALHKEIVKEFNNSYQYHLIDVKFIDDNQSIQIEFMRKFESLKAQNFHQQQEIQKALDEIDLILKKSNEISSILNEPIEKNPHSNLKGSIENHSNEINLILNCLEFLRVKILNRSVFLNQLKSDIQNDTTVFQLDLNQDQQLQQITQIDGPNINSNIKKTSSKSKITKVKTKQSSSKSQSKKSDQENKAKKNDQTFSFTSEIEKLKSDFISRLTKISVDYYGQFKTRKVRITRPDEIPQQQNDYLTKINEFWSNLTNSEKSILSDSILKFRYQVSSAQFKAKEAGRRIFTIFTDFCSKKNENQLNLAYKEIERELNGLRKEKEKNRSLLDFKMADQNNNSQLDSLIESEQKRIQKEKEFISKVSTQIFEIEKNCVDNFLNKLNYLTALSLSLFDKFILVEDLVKGPTAENEKRKTLRELKKDQIRSMNLNTSNNVFKRPFQTRNWPDSNQALKILTHFDASKKDENNSIENESNTEINGDLKNKRRKNGLQDSLQNDNQKETIRPDSTKQSGRKQKELKNKKGKVSNDTENQLISFDTPIHRTIIIEKNQTLDDFNSNLEKRAKKFNEFINSLKNEEENFENFWKKRISAIRPISNSLPKLDEAPNI